MSRDRSIQFLIVDSQVYIAFHIYYRLNS